MPFQKGHKLGKGNSNSGRKTKAVEFKFVLEKERKRITDEILSGKARDITSKVLDSIVEAGVVAMSEMEKIVMPITLKSMAEKNKLSGKIDLSDSDLKRKVAEKLAELLSKKKQ